MCGKGFISHLWMKSADRFNHVSVLWFFFLKWGKKEGVGGEKCYPQGGMENQVLLTLNLVKMW